MNTNTFIVIVKFEVKHNNEHVSKDCLINVLYKIHI